MDFKLPMVPGSEVLQYLAGLRFLNNDIGYPTTLLFRTTALASGAASQRDTVELPSDFAFVCDALGACINGLVADTLLISMYAFFNLKGSGIGKSMFDEPMPFSSQILVHGGGGGATDLPTFNPQPQGGRTFKIPYVFPGGTNIVCEFTADTTSFPAAAHVCDVYLYGYMVRKGLMVGER